MLRWFMPRTWNFKEFLYCHLSTLRIFCELQCTNVPVYLHTGWSLQGSNLTHSFTPLFYSQEENLKPIHRYFKCITLIPVLSYRLSLYVYPSYLSIRITILVVSPMDSIFLRFCLWEKVYYSINSLFYDILWYLMALFILLQVANPHTLRFYNNISRWPTSIDFFIQKFKWMFLVVFVFLVFENFMHTYNNLIISTLHTPFSIPLKYHRHHTFL